MIGCAMTTEESPLIEVRETRFVSPIDELGADDVAVAGGKGAALGALIRAELPVPEGFVVLTDAYRAFVDDNGLQTEIHRLAPEAPTDDLDQLADRARAIQELFDSGTVREDITAAISEAYEAMQGGPAAVRSSATLEDLPEASFAGQHDSYLNVRGVVAVCAAVKRCWGSLWNPEALAYRLRQEVNAGDPAMAVVVQRMIPADCAGVLFTANPLDHRRDRMLVNGSWGLGEAIVAGQVTPDQWVVDWETGAILEAEIGDKQVMTVYEGTGTATRDTPTHLRQATTLDPGEVVELVDLGRAVQNYFGEPQDIEWARAEGRFHLVQSRPITSLFPLPKPETDPEEGLRVYVSLNVTAQQMLEPLTPMGLAYWRALMAGFAFAATGDPDHDVRWFKVAAGRMFLDLTEVLRNPKRWPQLAAVNDKDPITGEALRSFLEREGDAIAHKGPGFRMPLRLVPLLVRLALEALWAALAPESARRRLLRKTDAAIRALDAEAEDLTGLTERVRFIEETLGRRGSIVWLIPVVVMYPGLEAEEAAVTCLERWLGDASAFAPVRRALPHNPTTEMGLDLWRLARRLEADGAEPTVSHPGVQEFLDRYGHRAVWEIDPGVPRWSEDPTYVLEVLRSYMGQLGDVDRERKFWAHQRAAEEAATELAERVRREKGPLHAWLLRRLIGLYRKLGGLREQPKFDGARIIALCRQVLQEAGRELVVRGHLDDPEDVFFLTLADLRVLSSDSSPGMDLAEDLRPLADQRQTDYRREMHRREIPRLMTNTGECIFGVPTADTENVLTGVPVSPGVHKGTARIIENPTRARLEAGQVLICRGTDPAWTPLFLTAGALVMETGGPVSHGSVVAREYGLPAVAGVPSATARVQEGMMVRVDGHTGQVTLLE